MNGGVDYVDDLTIVNLVPYVDHIEDTSTMNVLPHMEETDDNNNDVMS